MSSRSCSRQDKKRTNQSISYNRRQHSEVKHPEEVNVHKRLPESQNKSSPNVLVVAEAHTRDINAQPEMLSVTTVGRRATTVPSSVVVITALK